MTNTDKKQQKKSKKAGKIIGFSALILFGALVVYVLVCFFTGNVINFFGIGVTNVVTGSMEPVIKTNSIVIVDFIDENEVPLLKQGSQGDIVMYKGEVGGKPAYILHRLISINSDGTLTTKGDANTSPDANILPSDVVGVYKGTLPVLSFLSKILSSFWGFLLIAFIPCLVLIIIHIVNIVKLSSDLKNQKEEKEKIEEIKKQALDELFNSKELNEIKEKTEKVE